MRCRMVGVLLCVAACSAAPSIATEKTVMATEASGLVGSWRKVQGSAGAEHYPAFLRFEPNGLYRGEPEPPVQFTKWDLGTWRISSPGKVSISTANDAVIEYGFDGSGEQLSFIDPEGCRFAYRRER